MKFLNKVLAFALLLVFANAPSIFSQGTLIFEISDPQNKPLSNLDVSISQENSDFSKSYKTDDQGRVVDSNFPAGTNYLYKVSYGDYQTGLFSVASANYTWINIDYRNFTVTFKNDSNEPLTDKRLTLYKIEEDNTETLVGEKYSDEKGNVSFVLPEGKYKYKSFKGENEIELFDKDKTAEIEVNSGNITHMTKFRFVTAEGTPVRLYAQNINVSTLINGVETDFGQIEAHGDTIYNDYFYYGTTDHYISCITGSYKYSVKTKDHGLLTGIFLIDDNTLIENNIVDIVLPKSEGGGGGSSDPGQGDPGFNPGEGDSAIIYQLEINTLSDKDKITPIKGAVTRIESVPSLNRSHYYLTDSLGKTTYGVGAAVYNIIVLNDTLFNVEISSDTSFTMFLNEDNYTNVRFHFYLGDEPFYPKSVSSINTFRKEYGLDVSYNHTIGLIEDNLHKYDQDTFLHAVGNYKYKFFINENNYNELIADTFTIKKGDKVKDIDVRLKLSHNVDIYIMDGEDRLHARKYISKSTEGSSINVLTDSLGHYSAFLHDGDYSFAAFGDNQKITLSKDTTLYFKIKEHKRVKFQFLHDGKLVYPQIMNMDIYNSESNSLYSRVISTYYPEFNETRNAWVFLDTTKCEVGSYYCRYTLKDYEFDGTFDHNFNIIASKNADTTIYIVIPVKRVVSITVKDANSNFVTGVYGKIFKYNEDGTLNESTTYDYAIHEKLKTNTSGVIEDHLVPGRYQLQIIGMKRDFIVSDYDLDLEVISGENAVNVTYAVRYKEDDSPATHIMLDIKKNNMIFSSTFTDSQGNVNLICEPGNYSHLLHYGTTHTGTSNITRDTTIYIYLENKTLMDSMDIQGCGCVNLGDSLELSLLYTPNDASIKDVEWSVDKGYMARITSTGKIIANDFNEVGFITVTAKSTDNSKISASRKIYIGNGNCGSEQKLTIGNLEDYEEVLTSDSISLTAANITEDEFDRVFIYQVSKDSTKEWSSIFGPTTERSIKIGAENYYDEDYFFRVLSSTYTTGVDNFAKTGTSDCGSDKISNIVISRSNNITPLNWPDSICSNTKEISLMVDTNKLGVLPADVIMKWYAKADGDIAFTAIEGADNKDSISVGISKSTEYKVTLEKANFTLKEYTNRVFVEDSLLFNITASADTICKGSDVTLGINMKNGKASSYLWQDSTTNSTLAIKAEDIKYSVEIKSANNVCPAKSDSVRLIIDQPIETDLLSDKDSICSASAVKLSTETKGRTDLLFAWNHNADVTTDTTTVYPTQSTTYSVVVNTLLGKCASVSKEKSIMVSQPIDFTLSCNVNTVCIGSDITLSANMKTGKAIFNWNNTGLSENESLTLAANDSIYFLEASDSFNICPSKKDSMIIKLDYPVVLSISGSKNVICETESTPVVLAANSKNEITNLTWSTGSMEESISVLPKETTSYKVSASSKFGKCENAQAEYTVQVNGIVKTNLAANSYSICQTGNNDVTLTVQTKAGHPNRFIWWDGLVTEDSVRSVVPDTSVTYWAMATDSVCAMSDVDSVDIQVAKPASVTLSTTNELFEYGGTINLVATPSSFIYGPYSWISINEDGEEVEMEETDNNSYSKMPYADTKYYVSASNGACPKIKSSMIIAKLVDNVEIPTVFTPHEKNGENDDFMPGYRVTIYDRYGNVICDGNNGWDGDYKGDVADPGVYIYVLTLKDNRIKKGTIEVYRK
ncbi:MAG: gliding motility-associated C-terminal domain-containing protein [Paludibacteraceae bacterium]|nr:gliding motility-associated C-terminal domain-containing protein [Paludibacteraceae bacterium]